MPRPVADPHPKPVTKSEYLAWRACPEEAWLARHEPAAGPVLSDLERLVVEDPAFFGSSSIKYVLPTLVPALNYGDLAVQQGNTASYAWHRLAAGRVADDETAQVRDNLLRYCRRDTRAMVELHDWALRDTSDTHPRVQF